MGEPTKGVTEYRVFQDLESTDPECYWVATSTKPKYKYLSGIGNTPIIALAELLFAIKNSAG